MKVGDWLFLLQLVFLVLKLCGVITWGWIYVLIPAIILGVMLAISLILLLIGFIIALVNRE